MWVPTVDKFSYRYLLTEFYTTDTCIIKNVCGKYSNKGYALSWGVTLGLLFNSYIKSGLVHIIYPISTISSTIFIVESLCETSRMVLPLLLSFRAFNIIPSFRESRLLVGSSKRMKGAL